MPLFVIVQMPAALHAPGGLAVTVRSARMCMPASPAAAVVTPMPASAPAAFRPRTRNVYVAAGARPEIVVNGCPLVDGEVRPKRVVNALLLSSSLDPVGARRTP